MKKINDLRNVNAGWDTKKPFQFYFGNLGSIFVSRHEDSLSIENFKVHTDKFTFDWDDFDFDFNANGAQFNFKFLDFFHNKQQTPPI